MSQQINLLNPSLIKQKDLLNPNNILITLGVLVTLMLGYYLYAQKQLLLITAQRSQAIQKLLEVEAQLQQLTLLHTPHSMNKDLVEQIVKLEQKQAMQQHILQIVNQSTASTEKGCAALMRALAKQSLEGLWLTSFSYDIAFEQLDITGRALNGELVPKYIAKLGDEPALKGKSFSALNMNLPKATVSPTKVTDAISGISAENPTSITSIQNKEPKFIEFTLHSINDISASNKDHSNAGGKL